MASRASAECPWVCLLQLRAVGAISRLSKTFFFLTTQSTCPAGLPWYRDCVPRNRLTPCRAVGL